MDPAPTFPHRDAADHSIAGYLAVGYEPPELVVARQLDLQNAELSTFRVAGGGAADVDSRIGSGGRPYCFRIEAGDEGLALGRAEIKVVIITALLLFDADPNFVPESGM